MKLKTNAYSTGYKDAKPLAQEMNAGGAVKGYAKGGAVKAPAMKPPHKARFMKGATARAKGKAGIGGC